MNARMTSGWRRSFSWRRAKRPPSRCQGVERLRDEVGVAGPRLGKGLRAQVQDQVAQDTARADALLMRGAGPLGAAQPAGRAVDRPGIPEHADRSLALGDGFLARR